ncbi:HBL062Wp [Eremothecium sinecaudum]|uniref:HBL062Wp n=1 Tax=Eremothecium sinecaudum TaxID=45286 RepID=A0A120K0Z4_9SACH|nr:HBL062Wp [Eremothecium sinecaudum]AMD18840.1 HBL062Wp [Eremothecium sinecaudum]
MSRVLELSYEIDKLANLVEERTRLVDVLRMQPSKSDNVLIKKHLNKVLELLQLVDNQTDIESYGDINQLVLKYNECVQEFPDEFIDKELYMFNGRPKETLRTPLPQQEQKRVRFHDNPVQDLLEQQQQEQDQYQSFTRYTDNPEDESDDRAKLLNLETQNVSEADISPSLSNQDLFINQQQQLMEQDTHLEHLSRSVQRNHRISMDIHQEVDDQNRGILQDLDHLLGTTSRNLGVVKRKLDIYQKSAAEHGPCVVILVLSAILIFLVIVL